MEEFLSRERLSKEIFLSSHHQISHSSLQGKCLHQWRKALSEIRSLFQSFGKKLRKRKTRTKETIIGNLQREKESIPQLSLEKNLIQFPITVVIILSMNSELSNSTPKNKNLLLTAKKLKSFSISPQTL